MFKRTTICPYKIKKNVLGILNDFKSIHLKISLSALFVTVDEFYVKPKSNEKKRAGVINVR